ncbi:hypothetical protein [Leptospira andrefontaineae]|uniref:Uncharacterized protein n=1 Tax=Leptospira andrefontaineae TaxID=2484976 RepID=A0A4V3JFI9_9LEPT|nr:hypothetical protein [Leptospira andrefontaineae]TGK37237.1 hypothetical protein EHO65_16790 [Leptospira andrefontaineae]
MQKYSKVIAYSGNDIKHTFSLSSGIILLIISFILFVGRANGILLAVSFFLSLFLISYAFFRLTDRKKWVVSSDNDSIQLSEISGITKFVKLNEIEKFYFGGMSESSKSILKLYLQRNESIRFVGDLFESDIKQLYQFLKAYSEINPILREIESPVKLTAQWLVGVTIGAPLFILLYILVKTIFVK